MKKFFTVFAISFLCISISKGQLNFTLELDTAPITVMPGVHSGAFANHNGYWFFIGGRTNGLHGFLTPNAFPSSGINDSIYMIDPVNNLRWAQSTSAFDTTLKEMLQSSSFQHTQRDSMLYIIGGYGFNDALYDYITQPHLVAVNLNALQNAMINQTNAEPLFRMMTDSTLAVCGGQMFASDTVFHLVFGHRFDGRYSENDSSGFYVQTYTNSITSFVLHDDGVNLSISTPTFLKDTINFHRRDYNLVPQKFPDGTIGYTAFTGVFRYEAPLPYLDCINIYDGNTYEMIPNFNQNLNQYHTATMPVYDVQNNIMQTVFFGGTALYTYDTLTQQLVQDTMVPFVNTISKVTRMADSTLVESVFPITMPALMGTNATFIHTPNAPMIDGLFLDINNVQGNTHVGYIVGGILSPSANISQTGAYVSSAVSTVYRVWLKSNTTSLPENNVRDNIFNLICYPNPSEGINTISFETNRNGNIQVQIVNGVGELVDNIFEGNVIAGKHVFNYDSKSLSKSNIYFVRVLFDGLGKTFKLMRF